MNIKVVGVSFAYSTKQYNYLSDLELDSGDYVIVDSSNGPGLARVVDPDIQAQKGREKATHWILAKPDLAKLRQRIQALQKIT